ncbi:MAG: serine/threonine protein phosphatase [Oscillospiraceae bacterium]|nr:serine/threonine protein phosphatase [Oscillospiraceae bacterium]
MLYITGDTHCPIDIHKLNSRHFPCDGLTRDDYVIICGDAGLVWYKTDKEDDFWQNWLQGKPWTTLFVDGNHENHAKLDEYPVSEWMGGNVHFIKPDVIHLMRGQVYEIDGLKLFTMGGAASGDKKYRKENVSWWAREMPSPEEYDTAMENLAKHGNKVDMILSHCAPTWVHCTIDVLRETNELTDFLQKIYETVDFRKWYFGHYHLDRQFDERMRCVYNDIVPYTDR